MIYTNEVIKEKNDKKIKRKKALKCITLPIIFLILILVLYICYQKYVKKSNNIDIFGFKFYTIITGSMEPKYNIGDLIIIKDIKPNNIKVGDVITYSVNSEKNVTHRVTEIVHKDGETLYRTKGDNNNTADTELVRYNQIQGGVCFKINKLGKFMTEFLVSGIGMIIIISLILISYLNVSRSEERRIAREDARRRYNTPKYKKEKVI